MFRNVRRDLFVPFSRFVLLLCALALSVCGSSVEEDPAESLESTAGDIAELADEPTFAVVNGARLFYEMSGEGSSLVLISGANLDSRIWDDQFGVFAEDFQTVRYDPRGIGRSDLPEEPFSHYEDLRGLLDSLRIETAHVLGFSFGAGVALDFALAYPERVESLILVAPGLSSWKDELTPVLAELSVQAADEGRAKAIDVLLSDPSMPSAENTEARERIRSILEDSPRLFDSGFAYLQMMQPLEPPAEERLEEIGVPTLLIVGERDHPGIHENVDALQQGIEGARKVLIMGVGHVVSLEHPQELRRIVLDFLRAD